MRIAYQGVIGAYSEAAALRFNDSADLMSCPAFEDVFEAVDGGQATHGILPIENTIGGTIHRNYDLLLEQAAYCSSSDCQRRDEPGRGSACLFASARISAM